MPTPTATQRLASHILGQSVEEFALSRRPEKSWRVIAGELRDATGGAVDVHPETLRLWYGRRSA